MLRKPMEAIRRYDDERNASQRSTAREPLSSCWCCCITRHQLHLFRPRRPDALAGFDLVVLLNDSFFMAFMFLISGWFVRDSLERKGPAIFLRDRAWRLACRSWSRCWC